jgi:hypothetical protein
MLFLRKLKVGAAVVALAVVLTGVGVALSRGAPAEDPPPKTKPAAERPVVPAVEAPGWKADFIRLYGLRDGEFVRRVAPPHPDCRAEYFRDQIRQLFKRSKQEAPADALNKDYTNYFTKLGWKDGWTVDGHIAHTVPVKPEEGVPVERILDMVAGFARSQLEGDGELLERKVTGDFVVRVGADQAKIVADLERILRKECDVSASFTIRESERVVYVLSGKYESKPLPDRKPHEIEVYATDLQDRKTGGGGSGSLHEMAEHVGRWLDCQVVVDKVEVAPRRVRWHFNARSPFTAEERLADTDPDKVLANVAAQTGLTVKVEKRKVRVLVVKKAE